MKTVVLLSFLPQKTTPPLKRLENKCSPSTDYWLQFKHLEGLYETHVCIPVFVFKCGWDETIRECVQLVDHDLGERTLSHLYLHIYSK